MKKRILFLVAALALLLSACGGSPSSAMAEELSAKYDFYEKSAENIKKGFDVSADDADQVFLALVDCGISSEMGYITKMPMVLSRSTLPGLITPFPWTATRFLPFSWGKISFTRNLSCTMI